MAPREPGPEPASYLPKPGTTYYLPEIYSRIPLLVNPLCEEVEPRALAWERPYLAAYFGSQDAALRYQRMRSPHWGCLVYPHATGERFFHALCTMGHIAAQDDGFTAAQNNPTALEKLCEINLAVLDGTEPPSGFPLEQLFWDSTAPLRKHMPPGLWARYRATVRDSINCTAQGATGEIGTRSFASLQDYLDFRRTDLYGYWVTSLLEYAIGVDMSQALEVDELLALATDLCIEHMCLHNDLFSFRKEISRGEQVNAVFLFMDSQGMELQSAVDTVSDLIGGTERRFTQTCEQVRSGPLGNREDVDRYLIELGQAFTGSLHFHRISTRWNGDDFQWDGTTSGERTVETILSGW